MEKISRENISLSLGQLFVVLAAFAVVFFFIFWVYIFCLNCIFFLFDSFMWLRDTDYCQILRDSDVMRWHCAVTLPYYLYAFYLVLFSINLAETRVSFFKKQCQRINLRQTEGEKSESSIDFFLRPQTDDASNRSTQGSQTGNEIYPQQPAALGGTLKFASFNCLWKFTRAQAHL